MKKMLQSKNFRALALVLVSLATYKKAPTPFLDPYAKQKEE